MAVAPLYKRDDATPYSVESQAGDPNACFSGERNLASQLDTALTRAIGLITEKKAQLGPAQVAAMEYDAAMTDVQNEVKATLAAVNPEEILAHAKNAAMALDNAVKIGGQYGVSVPEDAQNAVLAALQKAAQVAPPNSPAALAVASDAEKAANPVMPAVAPANQQSPVPWIMIVLSLFGMGT